MDLRELLVFLFRSSGSMASGWTLSLTTGCQSDTGNCCLCSQLITLTSGAPYWRRPTLSKSPYDVINYYVFCSNGLYARQ